MRLTLWLLALMGAQLLAWSATDKVETLPAARYLQITFLPAVPDEIIWSEDSAQSVIIPENGTPHLVWAGKLEDGWQLKLNGQPVKLGAENRFREESPLPADPVDIQFQLLQTDGQVKEFRARYSWLRIPPTVRLRVREEGAEEIIEKSSGTVESEKTAARVELLANGKPVNEVDLDAARYARLAFRIRYPQQTADNYDGWNFLITGPDGRTVASVRQAGSPPLFLDWSQVKNGISTKGAYTYQIKLYQDEAEYPGLPRQFVAREGHQLVKHPYLPRWSAAPKAEAGYFSYHGNQSEDLQGGYAGLSLPVIWQQRVLARVGGWRSLPTMEVARDLSQSYADIGFLFTLEESEFLGIPYFGQVSLSARGTRIALPPSATVDSVTLFGALFEKNVVLFANHEVFSRLFMGFGSGSGYGALELGYVIPVRAWALRWGVGAGLESLYRQSDSTAKFTLFKMMTELSFIL